MIINSLIRRKGRTILVTGLWAVVMAYFGYHAVQGDHGMLARNVLATQVDEARVKLAELQAERRRFEALVGLMAPESIERC